jgi:prephenate dehydrogenase
VALDCLINRFMPLRQITIIGTGLIGASFALALRKRGFKGRIVGCDRAPVLQRAQEQGVIDRGQVNPVEAIRASELVLLATPIGTILDLIGRVGPELSDTTLLTDVGSTKVEVLAQARKIFGKDSHRHFLGGHPMAGKEESGVEFADPDLFQGSTWFVTPAEGQQISDLNQEFLRWIEKIGARVATIDAETHDRLCAWISHLPQMISTAFAAALVDEFGKNGSVLESGGRALREMTRISASPYSMWRDIALTNKKNIREALLQLEQRLAHIRENLNNRELEEEFERGRSLQKFLPRRHGGAER